ncbi:hypothetical protein BCR44DRAFT_115004, partial [Catenaria anguillulae PL171]
LALFALLGSTVAHMNIVSPFPRGSPNDNSISNKDYNIMAPILTNSQYPCQGKPPGQVKARMVAGSEFPVRFGSGAIHDGGHCQFSVSYNGQDFVVIHTIMNRCFLDGLTFNIPVPNNIPSAQSAVFQWHWVNRLGNREYYVNCIDVSIQGANTGTFS